MDVRSWESSEERTLLLRVRDGDLDAWTPLDNYYRPKLLRFAECEFAKIGHPHICAQDVTQETMTKTYFAVARGNYDPNQLFHPYANTIQRNELRTHLRNQKPTKKCGATWLVTDTDVGLVDNKEHRQPLRALLRSEQVGQVWDAIRKLDERQQQVLVYREINQFTIDEIAELMATSNHAVNSLLARARANLSDVLHNKHLLD